LNRSEELVFDDRGEREIKADSSSRYDRGPSDAGIVHNAILIAALIVGAALLLAWIMYDWL